MRILILGCTGLIGRALFQHFNSVDKMIVFGTYNNSTIEKKFKNKVFKFNALNREKLNSIIKKTRPNIVINCIGITKHIKQKNQRKITTINSTFPHYAKKVSNNFLAKFVQISTDCVFDGNKGNYTEKSKPNAKDIYGISKAKGEINDNNNLTIRTSTIGHEKFTRYGLLEWFLSQGKECHGFTGAYFNGFPTFYFAKLLEVILRKNLDGLIHVTGKKISKYELLKIIKDIYKKKIFIKKDKNFKIDRTLDNQKLTNIIGNVNKKWKILIKGMHNDFKKKN